MDKSLVTLQELQLYVKSLGKSNNDRVKIFLDNVFKIGISLRYQDIFPMKEFEYGDLLTLDYEFIYSEYLKFLKKNEKYDDVLFYIAENEYPNFYEQIKYAYKPLEDIKSHFKTRKELIEEEIERRKQEEIRRKKEEELKKMQKEDKKEKSKSISYSKDINARESEEMSMMMNYNTFFSSRDIYVPPETFEEKLQRQMEVNINKDIQLNIYARIRIEEHLKDVLNIRKDIGKLLNS